MVVAVIMSARCLSCPSWLIMFARLSRWGCVVLLEIFRIAVWNAFGRDVWSRGFSCWALSSSVTALVQAGCAAASADLISVPSINKSQVLGISETRSPRDACVWVPES